MVRKNKDKIVAGNINCVWGLMCSSSSVDNHTNNLSLFNIIDEITLPKEYFKSQTKEGKNLIFPLNYQLVLFWRRKMNISIDSDEIIVDASIETVNPDNKILQQTIIPVVIPKGIRNLRSIINIPGVVADKPGDYTLKINIVVENNDIGQIQVPFEVKEGVIKT